MIKQKRKNSAQKVVVEWKDGPGTPIEGGNEKVIDKSY